MYGEGKGEGEGAWGASEAVRGVDADDPLARRWKRRIHSCVALCDTSSYMGTSAIFCRIEELRTHRLVTIFPPLAPRVIDGIWAVILRRENVVTTRVRTWARNGVTDPVKK
jgi:hypothetical protein